MIIEYLRIIDAPYILIRLLWYGTTLSKYDLGILNIELSSRSTNSTPTINETTLVNLNSF